MATKFEALKGNWILLNSDTERRLINLGSISNIYKISEGIGEDARYFILFAPNTSLYSLSSDDPNSIWDIKFSGGKFTLVYDAPDNWNSDFDELISLLNQN